MVTTKEKKQIHMEDKMIHNPELEQLLEERQELKAKASEYRKKDKEAKDKINSIDTPPPFRVGRFVVERTDTPGRSVAFYVAAGSRLTIKIADE